MGSSESTDKGGVQAKAGQARRSGEGAAVGRRPEPSACTSGAVHAPPWLQVGPRGTATSRRDRVTGQHGPAS